jgi:hypothetical protein
VNERQSHQQEVQRYLQAQFQAREWRFELPHGWGQETYFTRSGGWACFVKLGVQTARYMLLAYEGLTPPVLAAGHLEDGTSILVQPYIEGRTPTRTDYRLHLKGFASAIHRLHHHPQLQRLLPAPASDLYRQAGLESLERIRGKWLLYRDQVQEASDYVDESLVALEGRVRAFEGGGLVASHNDICNANWLITPEGQLYLLDLESMSRDDPALDLGATLWWYYPPELRARFLDTAGCPDDEAFHFRMRTRLAMHCLDIALPRPQSFDQFSPASFHGWLVDFRAAMEGKENPQGYL